MPKWLKQLFTKTPKAKEDLNEPNLSAELVFGLNPKSTEEREADSGILKDPAPAPAPVPVLAQDPVPVPALEKVLEPVLVTPEAKTLTAAQPPVEVPASPPGPASDSDNPIINSINSLVKSILEDDAVLLKNYFFSIFMPPEDPVDDKKKSTAPNLTSDQETELKETLAKCASAYINDGSDLPPSGPSDPKSNPTKTTSTLSEILKEKAQPPVYFGVGIKTELKDVEGQKFLKITDIFSNSNLIKERQDDVDYTNQFITHLFCKLENDTEIKEYSIADIFNKFKDKDHASAQEKFDEKIDQIFRDINQASIKFKISADASQATSAEVEVNKIIFEKTQDGAYKQKTTKPSPAPEPKFVNKAEEQKIGPGYAV